jgi:perosamine synthetase
MTDSKLETTDEMWLFKSYAGEEEIAAVTDVLRRGTWWANGPEIEAFEDAVANVTGTDHAVAFNSGTTALYAQLLAHDVKGGKVIVPSFTFPATANAVVAAGAKPVFADIERDSLALSAESVQAAVSNDTEAIMPIHFSGTIARDIKAIAEIADDRDAVLLEDACHSLGASMDGQGAGSFGDAASFSFCFNKLVTTGEGGMIVTDSMATRDRLRRIRNHGRDGDSRTIDYGYNFRMASMNAALGVSQMSKLDWIIDERLRMATALNDHFSDLPGISIPEPPDYCDRVYLYYNLRLESVETQQALARHLGDRGVPSRVTYDPVHLTPYYRSQWGYKEGDLRITESMSGRILTLPFHLDLSEEDLKQIAAAVQSFFD